MNILMPRWPVSCELIDQFIVKASTRDDTKPDAGKYARLYLMYGVMEGEAFDVIQSARANGTIMRWGVEELRRKYAKRDYILHVAGRFYCFDSDWLAYGAIRPSLKNRPSAEAWPGAPSAALSIALKLIQRHCQPCTAQRLNDCHSRLEVADFVSSDCCLANHSGGWH
ncbi:MAG: hypothetical protein ACXWLW_02640 [Rhizomicrobium sp.]